MKKIFYLFLTFAIVGLGTISCSSDNNNPNIEPQHLIVGQWEYSKIGGIIFGQEFLTDWQFSYPECTKDFWEVASNGKLYNHEFDSYGDVVCQEDIEMSNYNISGNVLTIIDPDGTITFTIETLDQTTLKLSADFNEDFVEEGITGIIVFTRKNN